MLLDAVNTPGSVFNIAPFWIITYGIMFCFTKRGAKGKSQIHPNDTCTNRWAQLIFLRELNSVCLNVFSPREGFLQKALWSGTEHVWSSAPAAVLPSSADCVPLPAVLFVSGSLMWFFEVHRSSCEL